MKIPVLQNDKFVLYLEQMEDCLVIHCDVLVKWTKNVKKELLDGFQKLTNMCKEPLYALHTPDDAKHKKFLEMYGFEYHSYICGKDGNKYEIYVWR